MIKIRNHLPYAAPEIRAYAENICGGKDGFCADGTPCPAFSEIKAKVMSNVSYAENMNKLLNTPSALCG
jgi:hypothetical protein